VSNSWHCQALINARSRTGSFVVPDKTGSLSRSLESAIPQIYPLHRYKAHKDWRKSTFAVRYAESV
jgi:hypothetical protein